MAVDPTTDDVRKYVEDDDGEPVVMLNLLRYKGEEGRGSYEKYAEAVIPHLQRVGGEIVYAGECTTQVVPADGHDWDSGLLVRCPSRQKFLEMVMDPSYQEITHLRTDALEAAVLEATKLWAA